MCTSFFATARDDAGGDSSRDRRREGSFHLAVSVPPSLLVSDWIGELKGASAFHLNHLTPKRRIEWQGGYGVVSFGTKDLPWVVRYVENQKIHHARGTVVERLERIVRGC